MVRAAPPVCSASASAEATAPGGQPGLTWTATCSDAYDVKKRAALPGTRGCMILLASPIGHDRAENWRTFESIRRPFRFTR